MSAMRRFSIAMRGNWRHGHAVLALFQRLAVRLYD